jgi:hypothetical protein
MCNYQKGYFMKKLLPIALLACSAAAWGSEFDSFKFLSDKSLIKKECAEIGFGWGPFRNQKQEGCKYIHETLAKFNEPDREIGLVETLLGGLIGPSGRDLMGDLSRDANMGEMKKNVNAVLGTKYTQDEMRAEHNLLADTAHYIRKTRAERKHKAEAPKIRQRQDPY